MLSPFPSVTILTKLAAFVPDAEKEASRLASRIQLKSFAMKAAKMRERKPLRDAFTAAYAFSIAEKPQDGLDHRHAWLVGHTMRLAVLMLMDEHGLTPGKLSLSWLEMTDLADCFNPRYHGGKVFEDIRAGGIDPLMAKTERGPKKPAATAA